MSYRRVKLQQCKCKTGPKCRKTEHTLKLKYNTHLGMLCIITGDVEQSPQSCCHNEIRKIQISMEDAYIFQGPNMNDLSKVLPSNMHARIWACGYLSCRAAQIIAENCSNPTNLHLVIKIKLLQQKKYHTYTYLPILGLLGSPG